MRPCQLSTSSLQPFVRACLGSFLLPVLVALFAAPSAQASSLCDSLAAGHFDIVFICPSEWRPLVTRLAVHRASLAGGGYTSIVAPTETLATCHGPGRAGIRLFLDHAISRWATPPRHVVLVGAFDSYDTTCAVVPTWFIHDPTIGFWADARYVVSTDDPYVFRPGALDSTPVVSLGRIPVWDAGALEAYIDKVVDYDLQGRAAWKGRALHLIDDGEFDGNSGYLISLRADSLASMAIAGKEAYFQRSILNYSAAPPIPLLPPIEAWNAGLGFVLGYGARGDWIRISYLLWSDGVTPCGSPVARIPGTTEWVDTLHVNHMYPVVLAMTCGGGYVRRYPPLDFRSPTLCACIAQYMLGTPEKGAVAICGPSRAIRETAAYSYAREWLGAAFDLDSDPTQEPGTITMLAKQRAMSSTYRNEILSIHYLGDPAVQMPVDFTPAVGVDSLVPAGSPGDLLVRAIASPSRGLRFAVDFPTSGVYRFRLLDVQGRTVMHDTVDNCLGRRRITVEYPDSGLGAGVYFVIASGGARVATARIVLLR